MSNNICKAGVCFLDKDSDMSSMQAIAHVKRALIKQYNIDYKRLKLGHAGTLDPFATGVLPIFIGYATKFADLLHNLDKTYQFTVVFGKATNTGDCTGSVIETKEYLPTQEEIRAKIKDFIGLQMQVPHKFSAVHINGTRAYKLARAEQTFTLPAKQINILNLTLDDYNAQVWSATFTVTCSTGTYVRVLAEDLAKSLNTLAYVSVLRRIAYGAFEVNSTLSNIIFEDLSCLLDTQQSLEITEQQATQLQLGRTIAYEHSNGRYCVFVCENNIKRFVGISDIKENCMYAYKILACEGTKLEKI